MLGDVGIKGPESARALCPAVCINVWPVRFAETGWLAVVCIGLGTGRRCHDTASRGAWRVQQIMGSGETTGVGVSVYCR